VGVHFNFELLVKISWKSKSISTEAVLFRVRNSWCALRKQYLLVKFTGAAQKFELYVVLFKM
jgi:hypothetical protein